MEKQLSSIFYRIRDDKSSNLTKGLNEILESKDSLWNYRCASMCLDDTRIPAAQRPSYVIKHAKVFFENLDYELIVRFLRKVDRKPAYQEFIKSEYVSHYGHKAYQKYVKEQEDARIREEETKKTELEFLNSVSYVEEVTEAQKYSRLVYHAKSLEEKSMIVAAERVPYFSYKFVKEVLKTTKMPQEVKKALVMPHAEFVFASGDEDAIKKLGDFLHYKPAYKGFVEEKHKARVRVPQE